MKRLLVSIFACLIVLLNLVVGTAQAQSLTASSPSATVEQTKARQEVMEQLKTQLIPELESILTPAQCDDFESAVVEGKMSLRKAFKSMALTSDQKTKLATVFKSFPKQDFLNSLTPEQKKQFFMKKKEMFMPSAEEIAEFKAKKEK